MSPLSRATEDQNARLGPAIAGRSSPWSQLMSEPHTDPSTSARMSMQRTRDTAPEWRLRKILHGRGLRYRVDAAVPGLPRRRADVLFPRQRIAVFVDGCFWHGCPEHKSAPKSNAAWWAAKLAGNIERDWETDAHLVSLGWLVLRFWEHEDPADAADRVESVVRRA